MPAQTLQRTARVNLYWQRSGVDYAVNVLHYDIGPSAPVTQAEATSLAATIGAAFSANHDTYVSNTVSLNRLTLRDIRTANLPEFSATIGVAGASAAIPLPLQTSLVVTLRTAYAGRSYRGRIYLPGFTSGAQDTDSTASAACVSAAQAFANAIAGPTVNGTEWNLGVASFTLGDITPVTAAVVRDDQWDTQRRRAIPGI